MNHKILLILIILLLGMLLSGCLDASQKTYVNKTYQVWSATFTESGDYITIEYRGDKTLNTLNAAIIELDEQEGSMYYYPVVKLISDNTTYLKYVWYVPASVWSFGLSVSCWELHITETDLKQYISK